MSENQRPKPVSDATARDSAVDRVVADIEGKILSGALKDGDSLPAERSIVEAMGVSRPVAREAIKVLSSKGLVEAIPRHRPIVRRPNVTTVMDVLGGLVGHLTGRPGGIRQIFDIRIFLEAGLVRMAATSATKHDITRLKERLAENEASISDSLLFYETDNAFHGAFYEIPGNPIFPEVHRAFNEWLDAKWRQMPRLPDRNRQNFEDHKAILDAVLERDPDKAEAALRNHLEKAWRQVESTFNDL
ncbi:FCD domain-containing protein [Pacificoceanicola onchidii]|uniref:FCD domain-containing protein n=1 Tax=Pacificoceanicola onchidii TaxID=2562685 RepID=UPI0010A40BEF|nr:FCD domain-containing protein [Pacificoceanicola onchidii]